MKTPTFTEAKQLHRQGKLTEARQAYEALLQTEPNNPEILQAYGILLAMQHEYEIALTTFKRTIALSGESAPLLNNLGNVYLASKNFSEAIRCFERALHQQPNYAAAYTNLGNTYFHQQNYQAAQHAYREAIRCEPDRADHYYNLATADLKLNDFTAAAAHLQQALSLNPNHILALNQLAQLYMNSQHLSEAEKLLQRRLTLTQTDGDTEHALGMIKLQQGEFNQAISYLQQAIEHECSDQEAHYHLATAYLQTGDYRTALQHYLRQIQMHKTFEACYNAGVILMDQDRHQDAMAYFHSALELKPDDLATYHNLASLFLKINKIPDAIFYYEKILAQEPDNIEIQHILRALKQESSPTTSPQEYVQHLFDHYASHYDQHLIDHLHYDVPKAILKMLQQKTGQTEAAWDILDLGCGTGLCGPLLRPYKKFLVGVDLSQAMLDKATEKKCYDSLVQANITELDKAKNITSESFDLIIAADVFTYIGDLNGVFSACFAYLRHGGLFIFSVEKSDIPGFHLQQTIRFSHHRDYITSTAKAAGFQIDRIENVVLRRQRRKDVQGYLVLLEKI